MRTTVPTRFTISHLVVTHAGDHLDETDHVFLSFLGHLAHSSGSPKRDFNLESVA
jgi:hypothetical protein